jgi:hypothetical protein
MTDRPPAINYIGLIGTAAEKENITINQGGCCCCENYPAPHRQVSKFMHEKVDLINNIWPLNSILMMIVCINFRAIEEEEETPKISSKYGLGGLL